MGRRALSKASIVPSRYKSSNSKGVRNVCSLGSAPLSNQQLPSRRAPMQRAAAAAGVARGGSALSTTPPTPSQPPTARGSTAARWSPAGTSAPAAARRGRSG